MILIGIALVITVFSIEVQVRKMNKTNDRIVKLLEELNAKE
ncbi:hypothetical protein [Rossellomorea arthrocnemi]|jgi:hypothetical protein|nr:hypothetical protein [Rossellomorea arthrocnemi]